MSDDGKVIRLGNFQYALVIKVEYGFSSPAIGIKVILVFALALTSLAGSHVSVLAPAYFYFFQPTLSFWYSPILTLVNTLAQRASIFQDYLWKFHWNICKSRVDSCTYFWKRNRRNRNLRGNFPFRLRIAHFTLYVSKYCTINTRARTLMENNR